MVSNQGAGILDIAEPFGGFIRMLQIQNMSDPRDHLMIRYSRGRAAFSTDRKFINLDLVMYDEEGSEEGRYQGVLHSLFNSSQEILTVPAMPTGPMNEPVGPVPHLNPNTQVKGVWTFRDGSSISAIGPATSQLTLLNDGSSMFMVTGAQVVTGGTGRFEGVHGVTQSLGSGRFATGGDYFGRSMSNACEFITFDSFRVVERRYYGTLGQAGAANVPPPHQAGPKDSVHTVSGD